MESRHHTHLLVLTTVLRPHPHWTRREKRSKLGRANPVVATGLYTLHTKQYMSTQLGSGLDCCVACRITRVASSVDGALVQHLQCDPPLALSLTYQLDTQKIIEPKKPNRGIPSLSVRKKEKTTFSNKILPLAFLKWALTQNLLAKT